MTALSPREIQAVSDLADALYEFLPGTPYPRADPRLSFPGAAAVAGVKEYWVGGSKRPAIAQLLRSTLEIRPGLVGPLLSAIVNNALIYRRNKSPLTRQEMDRVNKAVNALGFQIPSLRDEQFLRTLADGNRTTVSRGAVLNTPSASVLQSLSTGFRSLIDLEPPRRGFAFERILNELFHGFDLTPRNSFRLVGEQIDGSFELNNATYLVEAKWLGGPVGGTPLSAFASKVESKTSWSRGLFVSYSGFTEDGLEAFARGRATGIVCMDGTDLWHVLDGAIDLRDLIQLKARRAVETGRAFIAARELFVNVT